MRALFTALMLGCVSCWVYAASNLPAYFTPPSTVKVGQIQIEEYGEFDMPLKNGPSVQRGKRWSGDMALPGVSPDSPSAEVWARLKPAFVKGGWQPMFEEGGFTTLRYRSGGKEAWAYILHGDPSDIRYEIVEIAEQARRLALVPPGKVPEVIRNGQDIAFMKPPPDFKLVNGDYADVPFRAMVDSSDQEQVLSHGVHERLYGGPAEAMSQVQFSAIYGPALKEAGWTIVRSWTGAFLAHYTKNGRDVWAYLHGGGGDIAFKVSDAGAEDLAAKLKKDCRAILNGVLFEFNKSTLTAESESALTRASKALMSNAALNFEVQGHTDNVGRDDYNQKLSQARAGAVLQWLTSHGVPAARLSAKGFGKMVPVASNDTPEGRTRNRRVELVCKK
jgi:outer membrane protein OmpA-like peptidoglycan-associated protein